MPDEVSLRFILAAYDPSAGFTAAADGLDERQLPVPRNADLLGNSIRQMQPKRHAAKLKRLFPGYDDLNHHPTSNLDICLQENFSLD